MVGWTRLDILPYLVVIPNGRTSKTSPLGIYRVTNTPFFDADHWHFKALMDFIAIRDLHELLSSKAAIDAHLNSRTLMSLKDNGGDVEIKNRIDAHLSSSLTNSIDHFSALTVLALSTTFEVATKDFFRNIFVSQPLLMHDFLTSADQSGVVFLADVVKAGDFNNLINSLAEKASNSAAKGKYSSVLARIFRLCKWKDTTGIKDKIDSIQADRNFIAHEKAINSRSIESISDAHSVVAHALEILAECAIKKNIPGRYTCVQRTHFLLLGMV
ncbi:hypothetical protein SAMN04489801_4335 [Pseudomonas mandelii]|uniref:RiboL-PSP-HEPN domain-containing protein n=1 Tax=Pseudomonas mandelii TaxID=75612 RepID=A0ABY0VU28_9PSED|nr:hypothetical protein SAMN04489801_4335 [Pseudomonas mandelii]